MRNRICLTSFLLFLASLGAAHAADFNGDRRQDLVWRTHAGNPVLWQMSGLDVAARTVLPTAPDAASAIVGTGNFFGGNDGGILWVDASDELSIWRISGSEVAQTCIVASGIDPAWAFLGVGDLNGDGIDDVLWRLPDGSVDAYLMSGCGVPQTITLGATAQPSWTFIGVGSVDTHTTAAVFWRDANGNVVLWRLHNGAAVFSTTLAAGALAGWTVAGVGDFDGDGLSDLLWHDVTSGQSALWLMNSTKNSVAPIAAATANVFATPDSIFISGLDQSTQPAPPPTSAWTILGAADFDGDGRADVLLADDRGHVATWQMQGASIQATSLIPASGDMPYTGLTGWRMPIDRPTVTKVDDQVSVAWKALSGPQNYVVYASSQNDPASTGVPVAVAEATLSFGRNDAGYGDKRYFAVGANYLGVQLPPSPEAYVVEFAATLVPQWGALAIADTNRDGCIDVLGALGDCHGHFQVIGEAAMGLSALSAGGRAYRDLRFADFNGDGILDAVGNVYACDVPGCGGNAANSQLMLFFGNADGTFTEDTGFGVLGTPGGGFGETIVIADFNNDGHLDIFLPKYTSYDASEHNFLLINDGSGHFADAADAAGVAMRNIALCGRPEGAEAADINGDGWIDLYAGSHLFLNGGAGANGIPLFADLGAVIDANCSVILPSPVGLPAFFDEGAKFIDLDNSGRLSLALNGADSPRNVHVLSFDGVGQFTDVAAFPPISMISVWGFNATDVDGDGLDDIVIGGGCESGSIDEEEADPTCGAGNEHAMPRLLLNRNGHFVVHDFFDDGLPPAQRGFRDLVTYADFDGSGTADFVARTIGNGNAGFYAAIQQATNRDVLRVSVLGANGEQNQAGRVVRASPVSRPDIVMTRVVDGGSGYMANSPYEVAFSAPYPGAYTITVRFAAGTFMTTARAGDHVILRANGTYSIE